LALKPFAPAERVLDALLLPTRILPELAAPLHWPRSSSVRAAQASLAGAEESARGRAAAWLEQGRRASLPTEPGLLVGRRRIHGEVVRRGASSLDRIDVRLSSLRGIEPGMPVVTGDAYVGRVVALHPERHGEVTVDLVTGADFFVGARLVDSSATAGTEGLARMVVGGLAPRLTSEAVAPRSESWRHQVTHHLAVHNPSPRNVSAGEVRVDEPRPTELGGFGDRWSWLANGFRLGRLEAAGVGAGRRLLRVRPELDYHSGLHQVIALAPIDESGGEDDPTADVRAPLWAFDPLRWLTTRVLAPTSLSPRRAGLRLAAGRWSGIREGAAVAFGARLVGVVEHAGWATAEVRLLTDPGLNLTLLAHLADEPAPRPLGEVVVLGRNAAGALRLRWEARLPLGGAAAGPLEAELSTGSGRPGVPAGLLVGTTLLPRGGGVHELAVELDPRAAHLSHLKVWRRAPEGGATP
jgi:hypothetical protein